MPWDNLVSTANKAEAKAKIEGSTHLDQRCHKRKQPLKMSLNSQDNQLERAQKSGTTPRAKIRLTRLIKGMSQRRLRVRRAEKKRREEDTWDNKIDEANRKIIAPL